MERRFRRADLRQGETAVAQVDDPDRIEETDLGQEGDGIDPPLRARRPRTGGRDDRFPTRGVVHDFDDPRDERRRSRCCMWTKRSALQLSAEGLAPMSLERWSLAIAILVVAAAQYGLTIYALRDLARRPSVRGNNKVAWGLVILTLPFFGPLLYTYMGPTSFLPRDRLPSRLPRRPRRDGARDPGLG
jgi:phospholipase D-like protein